MPSHKPPRHPTDDPIHNWLERSIQRPVYIDRSDGEKAAEELLIYEKAVTEKWSRWISKVWFTVKVGAPIALSAFLIGIWAGISL